MPNTDSPQKPYRGQPYTPQESETVGRRCRGELFPALSLDDIQSVEGDPSGLSKVSIIAGLMRELDPDRKFRLDLGPASSA